MTITEIHSDFTERVCSASGENAFLCYQCVKCTAGCPLADYFDLTPNQVMRAVQLGQEDLALDAKTPWLCASCQTCTTRCPQGIDVARVMDVLATMALKDGRKPPVPETVLFNKVFLRDVNVLGRIYELGLMAELNLRTGQPFKDVGMGIKMLRKGKMKMLPKVARPLRRASGKTPEPKPNQIAYYPGCSLHSTAVEFDVSTRAVCQVLDLELVEPKGWVCCGASAAHRIDPEDAVRLPMETLALIEHDGLREAALPCAACFNRFRTAQYEMAADTELKARIREQVGSDAGMDVHVRSLLDVVVERVGLDMVHSQVTRPLVGLKVACYYGCLLTRPPQVTGAANPEYPMTMDRLMAALGATVVDWSDKVSCCGASLSLTRTEVVLDLSARILDGARSAGADAVVVACPLCHGNLDGRQPQMSLLDPESGEEDSDETVPVLYFTQLMALAFGLSQKHAALSKNMIDPRPLLKKKDVLQ